MSLALIAVCAADAYGPFSTLSGPRGSRGSSNTRTATMVWQVRLDTYYGGRADPLTAPGLNGRSSEALNKW